MIELLRGAKARVLCAATFGIGALFFGEFAPAAPAASAPVAPAAPVRPVITDAAEAWKKFLATADGDAVGDTNDVFAALYAGGGLSAESCRGRMAALDQALTVNPVGVGLWNAGYQCAKLIGDESLADAYYASLETLATYALSRASDAPGADPIPVTCIDDINALLGVAGLDPRYVYIDALRLGRYYAIRVGAWDEASKSERLLSFDFLETMVQISRKNELFGYPGLRAAQRHAYLSTQTENGDPMGVDLAAVIASTRVADARGKVSALRDAAVAGGAVSAEVWLDICADTPFSDCGTGLVDALLPFAEKRYVAHTINLALAYSLGIGVERDEDNAMALLDVATKEAGSDRPIIEYARHYSAVQSRKAFTRAFLARLQGLADKGNLDAAGMIALHAVRVSPAPTMTSGQVKTMTALAARGYVPAYAMLARYHEQRYERPEAVAWHRKAAEAGDAPSQLKLARALLYGKGVPKDVQAGEEWMRRAALGGEEDAMEYEGWMASRHQDWKAAEAWYLSAAQYGSEDGAIALAKLYAESHPGVEQDLAKATGILDSLSESPPPEGAKARRELAALLVKPTSVKNPVRAIGLLQTDAERGDIASQFQLGAGFLEGTFGKVDTDRGNAWMDKVASSGSNSYRDAYAYWLYYKGGTAESRQRALELWKRLGSDGYGDSLNNLAWARCTGADPAVRDAADGLRIAQRMGDPSDLPASEIDTVAACYAAAGQYDRAVELQRLAIAEAGLVVEEVDRRKELEARLARYQGHQGYIEQEKK